MAHLFNSAGPSITDLQVRDTRLCRGTNIFRKQLEMKLIFGLQKTKIYRNASTIHKGMTLRAN